MSRKPIQDEFTDLNVSRQRKWQLRNPEKQAEIEARFRKSDKRKASNKRYYEKHKLSTGSNG